MAGTPAMGHGALIILRQGTGGTEGLKELL